MFDYETQFSRMAVGEVAEDMPTSIPADAFELFDTDRYWSTYREGFGRPKSTLNFNESPTGNYSEFESASITERTLEFDLFPQGDAARNIELLNKHLPFGSMRRFFLCTVDHRPCYIDGVVEAMPDDVKAGDLRSSEVAVRCPFPWFTGLQEHTLPIIEADTVITNNGDVAAGFCLYVTEPVTVDDFAIWDDAGNVFQLVKEVSFREDAPVYCSVDGKHAAVDREGSSVIGWMAAGSKFWKLPPGVSTVHVSDELIGKCQLVWREYYSWAVM